MSLLNDFSNSYFSDRNYKSGDFVLSEVNKKSLSRYKINMKVKDFKELVRKSGKYKLILTGGGLRFRRTKVYNYNDFKN